MRTQLTFSAFALLFLKSSLAVTISEINGDKFLSSYNGKSVSSVEGLVTAKGSSGFWIRSTSPDSDNSTSESIYVYGKSSVSKVDVGDIITLKGKVSEYRSSSSYLYLTEIESPSSITVKSSDNTVDPVIIGKNGLNPPTEQFSSLDNGDVLGYPNNVSQISNSNPVLQPGKYGLDFWESLSGELVKITNPRAIGKPNSYGDTWVVGDWTTTGANARGGLTMRSKDANPETIVIGTPLDGTDNPTDTKLGDQLDDITGVVTQAYGFYTIQPLTALTVTSSQSSTAGATNLTSDGTCSSITFGSYNVDNLASNSTHLPKIADHIANYLKNPTIVFLQEIQDNDGPTDDGVVSANETLTTLTDAIKSKGGISYDFIDIDPENDQDGGETGGNIRVAYLYDSSVVKLRNPNPGSSTDANEVLPGPELKYNPGRIDPSNATAWTSSRKPLAAEWVTLDGKNKFFTVNVHFTAKLGGSSLEGDARPPVNGGIAYRIAQAEVVGDFTSAILAEDANAKVITAGDFNEYTFVEPLTTFVSVSGLQDLDAAAGIAETERYTYLYDNDSEELDHIFISKALVTGAKLEHVHVNTWATSDDQGSDHDPSVALLNVCE